MPMRRTLGVVLAFVVLGGALLWTVGIEVRTTHLAFVSDGGPLQVPGAIRLQLTPSENPQQARLIGLASRWRVPVRVVVPGREGNVSFQVLRGGSTTVVIPCASPGECCRVLTALKYACAGDSSRLGLEQ